jgi:hypothetical protein
MVTVCCLILSPNTFQRFQEFAQADSEALGHTYHNTAQYLPATGQWAIPLSDDVAARLEERRAPGQSDDDLLNEVLTAQRISTNVRQ